MSTTRLFRLLLNGFSLLDQAIPQLVFLLPGRDASSLIQGRFAAVDVIPERVRGNKLFLLRLFELAEDILKFSNLLALRAPGWRRSAGLEVRSEIWCRTG
ncbi:hypothetical protein BC567DRAFT_219690 [Phyllosticta citribraziliensis]